MIVVLDLNGVFFTNGFPLGVKRIAEHTGLSHESVEQLFTTPHAKTYRAGLSDAELFWNDVERSLHELGVAFHLPAVKELLFSSYVPVEESRAFVERLRQGRIPVAFLSNNPADRVRYLHAKHGFLKHFDFGVFSFEAGARKPDKKIYGHLLRKCAKDPSHVVFVDDKEENLIPARELGMKTILFTGIAQLEKDLNSLGLDF